MKKCFRKINAAVLAGMMLMTAAPCNFTTVFAKGLSRQEQISMVQNEHKIPYTDKTEKTMDGTFLSVTGFAGTGGQDERVQDRSGYINTTYYCEVHTEEEFLDALQRARAGSIKVIEICEDLYLGWNELSEEAKAYSFIDVFSGTDTYKGTPCSNPSFVEAGVSQIELNDINGLTVFSRGGNKICHTTIKLLSGVHDLIIRNLEFTDLWDWRDQRTTGFGSQGTGTYTKLPYLKINGARNVWIDHCNFSVSYLANTDLENGASGVSITWCNIGGVDYSAGSMFYKTIAYLEELYLQNKENPDAGVFKVYKIMRDNGMTKEDIAQYMGYENLAHMCGAGDADSWWIDKQNDRDGNFPNLTPNLTKMEANERIRFTLAYNHWVNMGSRLPMMRGGVGHLVNCFTDNSSLAKIQELLEAKDGEKKSIREQIADLSLNHVDTSFLCRGQDARNGASIAADTCVYKGVTAPMIGREHQLTKKEDSNYQLNTDGLTVFGYNHSLIVNSKVAKPGSETFYTGSSWDFDGINDFTDGFTWNEEKITLGSWSWGKPKPSDASDSLLWKGYRHDMEDTDNDGELELSYHYQTFPLEDVEENVCKYAGAYTMNLTSEEWLKTEYTAEEIPDIEAKLVNLEQEVPIEKIELSKKDAETLYIQEEFMQLDARVTPSHTTEKAETFTWTSSNEDAATVNECGLVIPKAAGKTTITVTTKNGLKASCDITVKNLPARPEIKNIPNELYEGDIFALKADVMQGDLSEETVVWENANTRTKVLDETAGIFQALKAGQCKVKVTVNYPGNRIPSPETSSQNSKTATFTIKHADVLVTGVDVPEHIVIKPGEKASLAASVVPENATNPKLLYTVSDSAVAAVDLEGNVTGIAAGETVVAVTSVNGGFTKECKIKVEKDTSEVKPPVSPSPGPEGSQPPSQTVKKGDVNQDNKITLADAQMALKAALNLISLDENQKKAADVNGSGGIELKDAQQILKVALNLDTFDEAEKTVKTKAFLKKQPGI